MEGLNPTQRAAVTADDGPALVLAGAGSGKTRVIVERIVWLIEEHGVDPRQILALTFTNRAAGEMRRRVMARLGVERLACWMGTFHAFGAYVLRRDIDKLGRAPGFTIFDDADQLALMKRLLKALPGEAAPVSPRQALTWISHLKQDVAEPADDDGANPEETALAQLWRQYHAALEKASAVDFDDLLALTVQLFDAHPDAAAKYCRRYRYVLVDEYQDTNRAQYAIARHLAGEGGNLFVVGDEDQSIYSWRGANINNILDFERDFPGAQVFRLEQNYRSTAAILRVANAVVAHNEARLGKNLYTEREGGGPVRQFAAADDEAEARFVVEDITARGLSPGAVGVLFRTNGQARLIEEAFRRANMAYNVVGTVRFYARKEVKDLLCYLRLLVNPEDDEAVRRVINVPRRGIGNATVMQIEQLAVERGRGLLAAMRDVETDHSFPARVRENVGRFVHLIDDLRLEAQSAPVEQTARRTLQRTHYEQFLKESDEADSRARLEVVQEFLSGCAQFDHSGQEGLGNYLQELALFSEVDAYDASVPAATLMTCHSAKGLEFEHVFLLGLEEGLLPHGSAMNEPAEVEEERRLCYVAMTRAKTSLTLMWARSRLIYGERRESAPSRFLREIPPDYLENAAPKPAKAAAKRTAGPPRAASDSVRVGTRVRHARFGRGTVMQLSGTGPRMKARIRFMTGGSRTFMIAKAPLEILEGNDR